KQIILDQFNFQRRYLELLVDDIADDQMTTQPGGVVNHPAWHIGHLALVADRMAQKLGVPAALDGSWTGQFDQGTVRTAKRATYPSKAELLRALDDRRAALAQAYARAEQEVLSKPNPIARLIPTHPTLEHLIVFGMSVHEGTHLGQIATWRKAAGMVEALSKL